MEKDFIPHELALRLKMLGFDEPCLGYYAKYNDDTRPPRLSFNLPKHLKSNSHLKYLETLPSGEGLFIGINDGGCAAPTFSQAFRWFREKYSYDISIVRRTVKAYKFEIQKLVYEGDDYFFNDFSFDTYEEAELACIDKLIEIVEQK